MKDMRKRKGKTKSPANKCVGSCETCAEFTPIGEGDHICGVDPLRMPVSDYTPTDDYFWCHGRHYVGQGDG